MQRWSHLILGNIRCRRYFEWFYIVNTDFVEYKHFIIVTGSE